MDGDDGSRNAKGFLVDGFGPRVFAALQAVASRIGVTESKYRNEEF